MNQPQLIYFNKLMFVDAIFAETNLYSEGMIDRVTACSRHGVCPHRIPHFEYILWPIMFCVKRVIGRPNALRRTR